MTGSRLIEIPTWGTMNLVEAVWLASGLLALIVTGSHLGRLYDDVVGARLAGRHELRIVAASYLRREIVRVLQGGCLTTIGVWAATQPSALPRGDVTTVTGLVLTAVLLLLGFLVSVQSQWDWWDRHRLEERLIVLNGNHKEDS